MSFEKFKDFVIKGVNKTFDKFGKIQPVFIYIADDKFDAIDLGEFAKLGLSKNEIVEILREICQSYNPEYTAHVARANVLYFSKVDDFEKHVELQSLNSELFSTKNHPNKMDVIMISLCSRSGYRNNVVMRINDPVISKANLEIIDDYDSSNDIGIFTNLI